MFLKLDDASMADEIVKLHYCSDRDSLATRSIKDECSTVDQTIILGLQIILDHRSSRIIDQKVLCPIASPSFVFFAHLSLPWSIG